MTVDSPLELYTTLFAWRHYGTMYAVIALTGLVFLPFFWAVVEDVLRAVRGAPAHDEAAILAHRPILLDTAFALGVLLLAVMPLLPLPPSAVTYQAPCAADGQPGPTVAAGASGTTYDQTYAALLQQKIRVPLWWRLLLAIGGGINRAAIQAVGCRTDIALLRHEVVQVQIQDPGLFQNLQRFRAECYQPAYAAYQDHLPELPAAEVEALRRQYGPQDIEWVGSSILRAHKLYDQLHARAPVPGFAFDPARPTDRYTQEVARAHGLTADPQWGAPTCTEWWESTATDAEGQPVGLAARLLARFDQKVVDGIVGLPTAQTEQQLKDRLVQTLVSSTAGLPATGSFTGFSYNQGTDMALLKQWTAALGLGWEKLSLAPMLYALKESLPLVKAFLLMGVVLFLPWLLVVGQFRLEVVLLATVGLLGINFLPVIWHVAWVLENSLIASLWPNGSDFVLSVGGVGLVRDPEFAFKLQVLQITLLFLYVVLPLVFIAVMGWAGVRVFQGVGGMMETMTGPVARGSRQGADLGKNAAKSAVTKRL